MTGRRVKTLHDGALSPGRYDATWLGADEKGLTTAPGIYFVRMAAGEFRKVYKVTRVR